MNQEELLKRLYAAFDPFKPLPAGDPAYTDFEHVRGDGNILEELGTEILSLERNTYQLYSGHRGAGKSTELLRLQKHLEDNGCFVVYFDADEQDIDIQNAQYTDILLACTRHLLERLQASADPNPVLDWLKERWDELKELANTKMEFESLSLEGQISQFAKLTANLRGIPSIRQQIREKVNPHTVTLIQALNQFIKEAKKNLPDCKQRLVLIADSLDRIVPFEQENGRTNHEQIFVDYSEQLTALECDVIYTVPISMVYSRSFLEARHAYGTSNSKFRF
jgi:AAA ATPase domain